MVAVAALDRAESAEVATIICEAVTRRIANLYGLHELQAIAKWISDIAAIVARERLVLGHLEARFNQALNQKCQAGNCESGMGFSRRMEILIDTKMHSQSAAFKPAATPFSQVCWLPDFRYLQKSRVEAPRRLLLSRWHSELHMVQRFDLHLIPRTELMSSSEKIRTHVSMDYSGTNGPAALTSAEAAAKAPDRREQIRAPSLPR